MKSAYAQAASKVVRIGLDRQHSRARAGFTCVGVSMNGIIRRDEQARGNREKHTPFASDKTAAEARFGLACFY